MHVQNCLCCKIVQKTLNDDLQKKQLDGEILEVSNLASSSKDSRLTSETEKNDLLSNWYPIKTMLEEMDFDSEEYLEINKKMTSILHMCNKSKKY